MSVAVVARSDRCYLLALAMTMPTIATATPGKKELGRAAAKFLLSPTKMAALMARLHSSTP